MRLSEKLSEHPDYSEYLKGLTEAEAEELVQIEADLNARVCEGFTLRAIMAFVVAVPAIRKIEPGATIESVFDMALIMGLDALLLFLRGEGQPTKPVRKSAKRKTRSGVRLVT
jgi:hypothetical protein